MSSPSSPTSSSKTNQDLKTKAHGTKRGRDNNLTPTTEEMTEKDFEGLGGDDQSLKSNNNNSNSNSNSNNKASISPQSDSTLDPVSGPAVLSPLAKKGRRISRTADDSEQNLNNNTSKNNPPQSASGRCQCSSNEGSDHERSPKLQKPTPEANEVKSVRKKVEGMGVETEIKGPSPGTSQAVPMEEDRLETAPNQGSSDPKADLEPTTNISADQSQNLSDNRSPTSDRPEIKLPSSWAAYASVKSPFTAFAPTTTAPIFSAPPVQITQPPSESSTPAPSKPLARAFASPIASPVKSNNFQGSSASSSGPQSLGSSSANFPCGPEFFLKGKRNTPLGGLASETDTPDSGQHKKVKLPHSSDAPLSSTSGSSAFAAYATAKPASLRPAALERLNNDPSLQTPSQKFPQLSLPPPASAASSVCAVNGDADEPRSPSPMANSAISGLSRSNVSSPLGFSSFANSTGFAAAQGSTNWTDSSPSVFEKGQGSEPSDRANGKVSESGEWGGGGKSGDRASHLSSGGDDNSDEKAETFSVKDVITGEENEDLIKSVRCKVFTLGEDNSWHERGSGALRLLCTKEQPYRYRLIMRADAVLRVLLNVPMFKGFSYQSSQEKFLSFASATPINQSSNENEGRTEAEEKSKSSFQQYLCRFGKPEARREMIDCIEDCLNELKSRRSNSNDDEDDEDGVKKLNDEEELRGAELV